MNTNEIETFLKNKAARQAVLEERFKQLEELDVSLFSSKIGRFFGTTYFYIKRFITLILGLGSVIVGIILMLNYNVFVDDTKYNNEVTAGYKYQYQVATGNSVKGSITTHFNEQDDYKINQFIKNIDTAVVQTAKEKRAKDFKIIGLILFISGLFMLYISRMVKQIRIRNSKIAKAETLTQEIIKAYSKTITEEAKELTLFKELIKNQQNNV